MTFARPGRGFAALLAVLFLLTGVESAFAVHACGIHDLPVHGSVLQGSAAGAGGHHHGDRTDAEAGGVDVAAEASPVAGESSNERGHHGTDGEGESCTCPGTCHVASGAAIPTEAATSLEARAALVVDNIATRPIFERRHPPFFLPYSQAPPSRL